MRIFEDNGIFIKNRHFAVLDATAKHHASYAIISHAHSDHVFINGCQNILATKETFDLIPRLNKTTNARTVDFNKTTKIDDISLGFRRAGHILGSMQVIIEAGQIAFTNDFKLQESLIEKPAEIIDADVLFIESTFGIPSFSFPEREVVYAELECWVKRNIKSNKFVILAGYSIGKAQELTAFVNKFLGMPPLVHESIFKNNRIYEMHGISLGDYIKLDHNLNESNVLIVPPHLVKKDLLDALHFSSGKKIVSAKATGWPYNNTVFDRVFPLSDHADFNQIKQYIEQSNPRLVITMHGYEKELAKQIRLGLKIPAIPISQLS